MILQHHGVLTDRRLDAGLALRYQSMSEHRYCTMRSVIRDFDGWVRS